MSKFLAWLFGLNIEGNEVDVYCPNCGKRLTYSVKPHSYDMMTGAPTSYQHKLVCHVYDACWETWDECYERKMITETKDYPLEWRNGDF